MATAATTATLISTNNAPITSRRPSPSSRTRGQVAVPGGMGLLSSRVCDLCWESGSFMYRCIDCGFDVHPLCTMLPQTIRSPLHPQHDLHMVPSRGSCSSCRKDEHIWHYVCCKLPSCNNTRLHIACASGVKSSGSDRIAKFLIKTSFRVAVQAATGGLPVDLLAAIIN